MVLFYCHFPWKLSSFNALDPQTYGGDLMIHAAFANTEYKLKKLTAVLGLRGEQTTKVQWNTQLGAIEKIN
jgi:hypothetical protein